MTTGGPAGGARHGAWRPTRRQQTSAVFLCLVLALPAVAQEGKQYTVVEVKDGLLRDVDDETHEVKAGLYMPTATSVAVAQELAALRAETKALKSAPVATPWMVVGAVVVGVAVGFGAALLVKR